MAKEQEAQEKTTWKSIIIFLIFFFPIGIALLLIKLHEEKDNCVSNGCWTAVVGCIFVLIGISCAWDVLKGLFTATDSNVTVSSIFILTGIGYALVRQGTKYINLGIAYEQYCSIIPGIPNGSIELIASACQKPVDDVCKELQKMINKGFFPHCHIDPEQKLFFSPHMRGYTPVIQSVDKKPKVVTCPNCGAVNTVWEEISKCEYCKTPLTK